MDTNTQPTPASTLLITRPEANQPEKIYMLKRKGGPQLLNGAYVFPGGCVEPQDVSLAKKFKQKSQSSAFSHLAGQQALISSAAYEIAAIRETAEEAGVLFAVDRLGQSANPKSLSLFLKRLNSGEAFAHLLEQFELFPNISALRPLSRWITPQIEKRRYDTRFFIATLPEDQTPKFSPNESSQDIWTESSDALKSFEEGGLKMVPPTIVTLEQIALAGSSASLLSSVKLPIDPICPHATVTPEGIFVLVLPGDELHPKKEAAFLGKRTRFFLDENGRFV